MSKLRVNAFSVSADGFGAGRDQGRDQPLGRGGEQLHQWFLPTRTFQRNVLRRDGGTGIDNDFAARAVVRAFLGVRRKHLERLTQFRREAARHDSVSH